MKTCTNCKHARQRGKLDDQKIVGCSVLYFTGEGYFIDQRDDKRTQVNILGNGDFYEGWFYSCRRVGDNEPSDILGKGSLYNGVLCDDTQYCGLWEEDYEIK
jgi:hypothetical protein